MLQREMSGGAISSIFVAAGVNWSLEPKARKDSSALIVSYSIGNRSLICVKPKLSSNHFYCLSEGHAHGTLHEI